MTLFLEEKPETTLADEEVLVLSYKTPSMFKIIVDRYEPAFLRKVKGILGNREEVVDVVIETFTKIYLHGRNFQAQPGASFKSWAYRILLNTTFSYYQKLKRREANELSSEALDVEKLPSSQVNLEDRIGWVDLVTRTLRRMPEVLARPLKLFFLEDRSQEEIAAIEGISLAAVKTRIHRAKALFKKNYEPVYSA